MQDISVLLVDDDVELLDNLAAWLRCAGYQVRVAGDAVAGLALADRERFDVAVVDLRLPTASGLDMLAMLKARQPELPVVMLSGCATVEDAIAALRGRAFDFLQKPLRDLYQLNVVIERAAAERARRASPAPAPPPVADGLADRDQALLRLVSLGLENAEIGRRLGLSEKTVRNRLSFVFQKLGVANRTQAAAAYLRRHGPPDEAARGLPG